MPEIRPTPSDCLVVTDLQYDFLPGGALAVADGNAIVPVVDRLLDRFDHVIATQDWHPAGHFSFASSQLDAEPFGTIEAPYGPQTVWPDHCVQGTRGAEFHSGFRVGRAEAILRKGFRRDIDSYSAFYENDRTTRTGLGGYLRERGFTRLFFCGLATDFCVYWSVMDALREGFEAVLIEDACRAIDLNGSLAAALTAMTEAGATTVTSDAIAG